MSAARTVRFGPIIAIGLMHVAQSAMTFWGADEPITAVGYLDEWMGPRAVAWILLICGGLSLLTIPPVASWIADLVCVHERWLEAALLLPQQLMLFTAVVSALAVAYAGAYLSGYTPPGWASGFILKDQLPYVALFAIHTIIFTRFAELGASGCHDDVIQ